MPLSENSCSMRWAAETENVMPSMPTVWPGFMFSVTQSTRSTASGPSSFIIEKPVP